MMLIGPHEYLLVSETTIGSTVPRGSPWPRGYIPYNIASSGDNRMTCSSQRSGVQGPHVTTPRTLHLDERRRGRSLWDLGFIYLFINTRLQLSRPEAYLNVSKRPISSIPR